MQQRIYSVSRSKITYTILLIISEVKFDLLKCYKQNNKHYQQLLNNMKTLYLTDI
jgi:hypothetical protein